VTPTFDVAVVGSGYAGSLAAILARRAGRSVVLLERSRHPRFAVGESSSPLANLLLEELTDRYELPRIRPLAAWGTWQRERPEIRCGLKRGFTFYGHRFGEEYTRDAERSGELLVAASPSDEVADTHWYRADFDHFLATEAAAEGAEYLDLAEATSLSERVDGFEIAIRRAGRRRRLRARFLIDASGPGGFLNRSLGLEASSFPGLPGTSALFTHFESVRRLEELPGFASAEEPPYPPDDAAVHHVFDGGWIWVLRFENGITSAGVAARPELARDLGFSEGVRAWERLLSRLPSVAAQFAEARPILPFVHGATMPFRSSRAAGGNWAMLPSAAAFVDPMLSTGFPLALLGLERLARMLQRFWDRPEFPAELERYGARTLFEADAAALLVAALYARFADFEVFAALTHLYFAAASFAETARRLGRPALSGSFLSADHPAFGPAFRRCCCMALDGSGTSRADLLDAVREAIAPFDLIGLSDRTRHNWYPVDAADLLAARHKVGASEEEIRELFRRAGIPAAEDVPAPAAR
jgi:FADH2 O2-dependent halogenase